MLSRHKSKALDLEKHSEVSRSSRHIYEDDASGCGNDHNSNSDELTDDDEFGGAKEDEQANVIFLRELKQDYQNEHELSTPTLLWVTPSQLQSRLPMGLDNEKHEDITELRRNSSLSLSKSKRFLLLGADEDNDIANSSDEEFGNANDSDEPMPNRLRDSCHSRTQGRNLPTGGRLTAAALLSRTPASLDVGKHEEIGHLMDSRHARSVDSIRNTRTCLTFDEFGDANSDEAPDNSYLQDLKQEMFDLESRAHSIVPMATSQSETRTPEGLDKGKHEDLGNLMDSLRYESYDEFEDGSLGDMPQRKFLCHSTHSRDFSDIDEDEVLHDSDEISMDVRNSEEPPPLPAALPSPLPAAGSVIAPAVANEEEQDSIQYEPLKGFENDTSGGSQSMMLNEVTCHRPHIMPYAHNGSSQGLDDETHEELDLFQTSASVSDSEFGSASTLDVADAFFLEQQTSQSRGDESESLSDLAEGEEDDESI